MNSPPIDPLAARLLVEFKHSSPLIACRFDPAGRYLFVSAQDNTIQRFDLLAERQTPFAGHESWVRALAFAAPKLPEALQAVKRDEARRPAAAAAGAWVLAGPPRRLPAFTMISGDYHGKLIWWAGEADAPKPIRDLVAHDGWVRAVAVSPDGKTVASCGNDRLVKLWSLADGKLLQTLKGHENHVYNVAFHPDGGRLVSGDLKGIVKDWELKTGSLVRELDAKALHKYDTSFMADIGGVRAIAFRKDGSELACAGISNVSNAFAGVGNPLVLLFNWKDGQSTQLKPKDVFQGTAWGVGFHPAGYVVAAGGAAQGRIWFWKQGETATMHTVTVPVNCRDLSLHPDGQLVAVACANGTAKVYTLRPDDAPAPKKK
jgi:WD40 repeat protein